MKDYQLRRERSFTLALFLLLGLGVVLRIGFLGWQPLWADEGYSIYFATESVARLLWLTAHDIHPPLYYLLLHGWTGWSTAPNALRLFSIIVAAPALFVGLALARTLFGGQRRPQILFLLLLLGNPLYLYYSQEIRMYGLALSLSIAATFCCWQWVRAVKTDKVTYSWLVAYTAFAALSLYTLYYLAFLLLAHLLWVSWELRSRRQPFLIFVLADGLLTLLYVPWVIYTARILIAYVNDKVRSDQDITLGPLTFLMRHLLAFTSGHLPFPSALVWLPWLALLLTMGLLLWSLGRWRKGTTPGWAASAQALLWLCCAIPLVIAFLVNLFYPFFPDGGERLLLFVLPYFLLLLAGAIHNLWRWWAMGRVALALLMATAGVGVWVFYTLPRYQDDDYRPLIRQIVQQGSDSDTVLATFPWQVGLWRAYASQVGLTPATGPHLQLISDRSVRWGPEVMTLMDNALDRGMLWIPSLRSIGSTLPKAMDEYLQGRAVNFAQRWVGATTLDGWHRPTTLTTIPVHVGWGDLRLVQVRVSTTTVSAANTPLIVALGWQNQASFPGEGVTLRLQKDDQSWANRDYAPIGAFATAPSGDQLLDEVGLIVPAGLPPGDYTLSIGLIGANGELRKAGNTTDPGADVAPLTMITITAPTETLPPYRLPIQSPLLHPVATAGVTLIGYSGGDSTILAGTLLDLTLFWQSQTPLSGERHLYISLLDKSGASVAGWEGWPIPTYPLSQWPAGALVQTPVSIAIPPTVASGAYRLVAGLLAPSSGEKEPPIALGAVRVHQRMANFTLTLPPIALATLAQFGTHVQLLGYGLQMHDTELELTLYWQVLQPLFPPHRIFVHLDDATDTTLAQTDDTPQTIDGPAPTGSWQPNEYLVTRHTLTTPARNDGTTVLRIGIYLPATGARLPLTIAGQPVGDAFLIQPSQ